MKLEDLKPAEYNPREISEEEGDGLAYSLEEFGDLSGVTFNKRTGNLVTGHQRLNILREEHGKKLILKRQRDIQRPFVIVTPAGERFPVRVVDWDLLKEKAANLAANSDKISGRFTPGAIQIIEELEVSAAPLIVAIRLDELKVDLRKEFKEGPQGGKTASDSIPDPPKKAITKPGDLWILGKNKILCGDSTIPKDVCRLFGKKKAVLLHSDPPYGMGKEKEGVANDNLYREKLDAFQMKWWATVRPFLECNASAYIWGNSEDLWRLWYSGGLRDSERLTFRNEITWDKREDDPTMLVSGVPLESRRMYHPTERCLFFMLGHQEYGSLNKSDYWEGFEPLRLWMNEQVERAGWSRGDIHRITGTQMAGHWLSKSQFAIINRENYEKLQKAAKGKAFVDLYDEMGKGRAKEARKGARSLIEAFYETRAFFDNTHDSMTDVWSFERVTGDDRFGHATPKPVEMISRAILSSSPKGSIVLEPFLGTGSTLIACEQHERVCVGIEIDPRWVDVAVERYENFTGKKARRK